MPKSALRWYAPVLFLSSMAASVMGCPKKQVPAEDAAAPASAPVSAPTVTELAPLTEEAGEEAGAAEASAPTPHVPTGLAYNSNQAKIKACCNAIRAQAKTMGPSPEAFQLNTFAGQCDTFAVQMGPLGTAPEFNQLRQILKNVRLPSACQF